MQSVIQRIRRGLGMSVTVMLIPHSVGGKLSFKMPLLVLLSFVFLALIGGGYAYSLVKSAVLYVPAKEELEYYKDQFVEIDATISNLTSADNEFKGIFGLKADAANIPSSHEIMSGDIDLIALKSKIDQSIETVGEIRDYLSEERDLYMATPMGWPVEGWLSSGFGYRWHPIKKTRRFHAGLDIATRKGKPVRVTADGVVSFSGRNGSNGNLVAIEHGFGFSTYYAHNRKNAAKVGDVVKRGDIIAYVGSTGRSTGPHVHYEVWKNGKTVNPITYIRGSKW